MLQNCCRFTLLQKIRVAKRFDTTEGRRQLVCNRLMAINVYLQSVHNPEQISTFFMAEGELVNEIIALVEADKAVPEPIRTLALKAIAVQVKTHSKLLEFQNCSHCWQILALFQQWHESRPMKHSCMSPVSLCYLTQLHDLLLLALRPAHSWCSPKESLVMPMKTTSIWNSLLVG